MKISSFKESLGNFAIKSILIIAVLSFVGGIVLRISNRINKRKEAEYFIVFACNDQVAKQSDQGFIFPYNICYVAIDAKHDSIKFMDSELNASSLKNVGIKTKKVQGTQSLYLGVNQDQDSLLISIESDNSIPSWPIVSQPPISWTN